MPNDDAIHQANDKIFKAGFSEPATTAAFLRHELPLAISSAVDWEKLQLVSGSFIDSQFRASETDLLFSAPTSGLPCLFYLLFEHQTKRDAWLGLRLLRYMVRVWEAHLKGNPTATKLPPVLPVVLAQNAESWQVDTRFSALLELPTGLEEAFAAFVPSYSYRLLELGSMDFGAIRGTPTGILILRLMKAEQMKVLLNDAVWDEELLSTVPSGIFELVLRYILGSDIDRKAFERRVHDISNPRARSNAMTLAQQYHQEGRTEGRLEGRLEGQMRSQQQAVLDALEINFEVVPEGLQEKVNSIREETKLRLLLRAAIKSDTLEEFASYL